MSHASITAPSATTCNTLRRTTSHCNTLQYDCDQTRNFHTPTSCSNFTTTSASHCNSLECTITQKLQHKSNHTHVCHKRTLPPRLQHIAAHCNSLQHTAPHFNRNGITHTCVILLLHNCVYNTLQHTATHCNTLLHISTAMRSYAHTSHANFNTMSATHRNTMQRIAIHCTTMQQERDHTHLHHTPTYHTTTGMRSHTHTSNANFTTMPPRVREALSSQTSPGSIFISSFPFILFVALTITSCTTIEKILSLLTHPPLHPIFGGFTVTKYGLSIPFREVFSKDIIFKRDLYMSIEPIHARRTE